MKRGTKPKPTALKKLAGNSGHRALNLHEPPRVPGIPDCPAWLDDEAKAKWHELTVLLDKAGVLSRVDADALLIYCELYARWVKAEGEVRAQGITIDVPIVARNKATGEAVIVGHVIRKNPALLVAEKCESLMRAYITEFGMTPSSRTRVRTEPREPDTEDETEKFFRTPSTQKPI